MANGMSRSHDTRELTNGGGEKASRRRFSHKILTASRNGGQFTRMSETDHHEATRYKQQVVQV
jgi:hypothetical protein